MPSRTTRKALVKTKPAQRERISAFALKSRLPVFAPEREFADAGSLLTYAPVYNDLFRRAATSVKKILAGAKPADLPVEQPTKFEFVINLETVKTLGLTIPHSILLRANRVIE